MKNPTPQMARLTDYTIRRIAEIAEQYATIYDHDGAIANAHSIRTGSIDSKLMHLLGVAQIYITDQNEKLGIKTKK